MGLYDINETKLKKIIGCAELKLAEAETVTKVTGAKVGYAGILNLPADVRIFMDDSMQGRKNFEMGANKTDYHTINVNFGRDIKQPEQFYDFALVKEGYESAEGQKLSEKNGIEVGNIFQLGLHYSKLMHDAEFTDENGQRVPYYMGCYGIGLGRTLATIVEKHHDDKGIIWPEAVAPYQIHLIGLDLEIPEIKAKAEAVYQKLLADGKEVLFDDRVEVMAGQKFNDADLIGIPTRMVVSKRSGDQVEVKQRDSKESSLITI